VALAATTITVAVARADDFMQKCYDEIGKCTRWHLTEFFLFDLSLFFSSKAHRAVLDNKMATRLRLNN
jgi:hypothetical protein